MQPVTENGLKGQVSADGVAGAPLVVVRGAGDIATGSIQKLRRAGFRVLALEVERPSAIRRLAALSEACYNGRKTVEDVTAVRCADLTEALSVMAGGQVALLVDPEARCLESIHPAALVDAILAKRNLGTHRGMAPATVALGPGFSAGTDVDIVVETMRGHHLGRLIFEGPAIPNTGVPGLIAGAAEERVIHAPAEGVVQVRREIRDLVKTGERIAEIVTSDGRRVPVPASLTGVIRGMIPDGYAVPKGFKIADIDPRPEQVAFCDTISDKARCVGGGTLEAVLFLLNRSRKIGWTAR